jgi:hypothetical protein
LNEEAVTYSADLNNVFAETVSAELRKKNKVFAEK